MSEQKALELRVSVDVGFRRHRVAMGLSSGEVLEEFEIDHRIEGFEEFFSRIETHRKKKNCGVALAGEIGTIERFGSEGSLSLYLGMSTLDNSSGRYQGTKAPKHVNTRAKAAMMTGVDRHRKYVPESQRYYEKKRSEGKKHNQAIRALGRHLCRIIYKMLKEERQYRVRPEKGNTRPRPVRDR